MDFNPDAYLAKYDPQGAAPVPQQQPMQAATSSSSFNPDAYLAKYAPKTIPSNKVTDELPYLTQAAMSFGSSEQGQNDYLKKKYPGIQFATTTDKDNKPVQVVKLPGENSYRYMNQPGFTMGDIARQAGNVPAAVLGTGGAILGDMVGPVGGYVGAGLGSGAGEAAKKYIGRNLVGIPEKPNTEEDVKDIALAGGIGVLGQGVGNRIIAPAIQAGKGFIQGLKGLGLNGEPIAQAAIKSGANIAGGAAKGEATGAVESVAPQAAPQSVKELSQQMRTDLKNPEFNKYPSADTLKKAVSNLPDLQNKPLPIHEEMLKNKSDRDVLGLVREAGGDTAQALNHYENKMKNEATEKVADLIHKIGNRDKISTPLEAGENLIQNTLQKYHDNKDSLGPLFEEFKSAQIPKQSNLPELKDKIAGALPTLNKYLKVDEDTGNLVLDKFSPKMGISQSSYGPINDALNSLNSKNVTFPEMQSIREYLRLSMDPLNPKSTAAIGDLRKAMLDHMSDLMDKYKPNSNVKEVFKKYAVNETNLQNMEVLIGGKLENLDPTTLASADKVYNRIFSSDKNMNIAKKVLGPEEFQNALGDHLSIQMNKASTDGVLSSNKFNSALNKQWGSIQRELGTDASTRLRSLLDVMRLVPDRASINPSGTAKSIGILDKLKGLKNLNLENVHDAIRHPLETGKQILEKIGEGRESGKAVDELNSILSKAPEDEGKGLIGGAAQTGATQGLLQNKDLVRKRKK